MQHVDPEKLTRDQLIAHVYNLEARLEEVGAVVKAQPLASIQVLFGLTVLEGRLLATLSDGRIHSKESLLSSLYFDRADDAPEIKIVDVFVCKLRKKLVGYPIRIDTVWATGYRVADPANLIAAMAGEQLARDENLPREPSFTKPAGVKVPKPHVGTYQARALSFIASRGEGVVVVTARDVAAAAGGKTPGAVYLTAAEERGYIEILKRARRAERGGKWHVRLLDKGRRALG